MSCAVARLIAPSARSRAAAAGSRRRTEAAGARGHDGKPLAGLQHRGVAVEDHAGACFHLAVRAGAAAEQAPALRALPGDVDPYAAVVGRLIDPAQAHA